MAARKVWIPSRGQRPIEIVYRDSLSRGPSRLPAKILSPASDSTDGVETIPSNGLRSIIFNKRQSPLFGVNRRQPSLFANRAKFDPKLKAPELGKYGNTNLYTKRHNFPGYTSLLKLIDEGCIVEAMTRFYMGSRSWALSYNGKLPTTETSFEISPHIIHDLMEKLTRLATTPAIEWRGFTQKVKRDSYWIPTQAGSKVDVREADVPTLAFHALVDVYDIGGAVGISLDDTAMASMMHAISYHLDVDSFTRCIYLNLLRLSGLPLVRAHLELGHSSKLSITPEVYRLLSPVVVKEIIEGYGRMGAPQIGEAVLRDWSSCIAEARKPSSARQDLLEAEWRVAASGDQKAKDVPAWMDISGWASNSRLWTALIRSRADASDLAGARYWLNLYRQEGLNSVRKAANHKCGLPHSAYIMALSKFRKETEHRGGATKQKSYIENGKTRYQAIIDTIRMMHQDGAQMTEDLLLTCISVHLGYNKIAEAALMIKVLLQKKEFMVTNRPSFYRIFFHLHRAVHSRRAIDTQQLSKLVKQGGDESVDYLANLRALFQEFYLRLTSKTSTWSRRRQLETLIEALRASLAARDLPLAWVILHTFQDLKFPATDQIMSIVAGHTFEKPAEQRYSKDKKFQKHHADIVANQMAWLKANSTEEMPFEQHVFHSTPVEDANRFHKVMGLLIEIVESKIVQEVHGGLEYLEASDPQWLHDICPSMETVTQQDDSRIARIAILPIIEGLGQRNPRVTSSG